MEKELEQLERGEKALNAPLVLNDHPISLRNLIMIEPGKDEDIPGEKFYLSGLSKTLMDAYQTNKKTRLDLIKAAIANAIAAVKRDTVNSTAGSSLHAPDRSLDHVSLDLGTPFREDETENFRQIDTEFRLTRAQNDLTVETRNKLLGIVSGRLRRYISELTEFGPSDNSVPLLLQYVQQHGRLPQAIQQSIFRQGGENAYTIAKLLYYFNILSRPAPLGFQDLASLEDWGWLFRGSSQDNATRLFGLIHALHQDRNFTSGLSRQQVYWAHSIYKLLQGGIPEPIYAEAGTGKTATAQFIIRFLKAYDLSCREKVVHMYSPFATSPIDGMQVHELQKDVRVYPISVDSEADLSKHVVLVDEGHLLDPNVQFLIRAKSGATRSVEPLQMTATPVIPQSRYAQHKKEITTQTLTRLSSDADAEITTKDAAIRAEKIRCIQEELIKCANQILISLTDYQAPAFLEYVPIGLKKNGYYKKAVDRLANALKNPTSHKVLIVAINHFVKRLQQVLEANVTGHAALKKNEAEQAKAEALLKKLKELRQIAVSLNTPDSTPLTSHRLTSLFQERNALQASKDAMDGKINTWARKAQHAEEQTRIHTHTREQRVSYINRMIYSHVTSQAFTTDSAASAGTSIATTVNERVPGSLRTQVLLPGVRFTETTFDLFVTAFVQGLTNCTYPLRVIYHDSHSGEKGVSYVREYATAGVATYTRMPLSNVRPTDAGTTIMLYDTTNIQGGDFNEFSRATPSSDIQQLLFYTYSSRADADALTGTSQNDVYQAMRRRRGVSELASLVFGPAADKEAFARRVAQQQALREKGWAIRAVVETIALKRFKARVLNERPDLAVPAPNGESGWRHAKRNGLEEIQRETRSIRSALEGTSPFFSDILIKEKPVFADTEIGRRMKVSGGEYLWEAMNAFDGADHLFQWASGYGGATASTARTTTSAAASTTSSRPMSTTTSSNTTPVILNRTPRIIVGTTPVAATPATTSVIGTSAPENKSEDSKSPIIDSTDLLAD